MTPLEWLAAEIRRRKHPDRPLKVAIDGRCASGKTSLADALALRLRADGFDVLRPSVDGFHHPKAYRYRQGEYSAAGYYEDAFDYAAIVAHLLGPLSGSTFPTSCRQASHDVRTDVAIDDEVRVSAHTVLLFDGVFLFRPELNSYWDFRVLLDVDAATAVARAVERDGRVGGGPADVIRRKYDVRYEPAWRMYCERGDPEANADVVIANSDVSQPRFLKGGTAYI